VVMVRGGIMGAACEEYFFWEGKNREDGYCVWFGGGSVAVQKHSSTFWLGKKVRGVLPSIKGGLGECHFGKMAWINLDMCCIPSTSKGADDIKQMWLDLFAQEEY